MESKELEAALAGCILRSPWSQRLACSRPVSPTHSSISRTAPQRMRYTDGLPRQQKQRETGIMICEAQGAQMTHCSSAGEAVGARWFGR